MSPDNAGTADADTVSALPLTVRAVLGAIAGAVVPLSFNPFNMWPLGMLGMALLYLLAT